VSHGDVRAVVERLFEAIGSRDLRRIHDLLTPGVVWQNVPHPAVIGREAVLAVLAGIITWSDCVRWEIISCAVDGDDLHVEHVDHFVIDGIDHAVACNGIVRVDDGRIDSVRDFVDLGEWRERIGPTLAAMAARPAAAVIDRHLGAVLTGDPVAMAADYTLDATLVRPDRTCQGWREIACYFDTVPARLAGRSISFGRPSELPAGRIGVEWRIEPEVDRTIATGYDVYDVVDGRIHRQTVTLATADF
jgi:limonene-1,2-epoxide hydrolase